MHEGMLKEIMEMDLGFKKSVSEFNSLMKFEKDIFGLNVPTYNYNLFF